MAPVSYGLWQRCELVNITIMKQGVALGIRPNVQLCRPNRYMRYSPDKYETCYYIRRNCPVTERAQLPDGCSCRYLPSTKFLQWLTIFTAVFLVIGLLLLYLKTITSPQNGSFIGRATDRCEYPRISLADSAVLVLSFGPFVCFVVALILMVTTLILVGACKCSTLSTLDIHLSTSRHLDLRRDTYEDYTFPLASVSNDTNHLQGFDLHSLRNYAKHHRKSS